jgi:hypothetical protein
MLQIMVESNAKFDFEEKAEFEAVKLQVYSQF